MQVQCKDCPQTFEITDGEVEFFKDKGLELPKRCPPCRQLKRNRNNGSNRPFDGKIPKRGREDRPRRAY